MATARFGKPIAPPKPLNATGIKAYAGSKDKNAGEIKSRAMTSIAKPPSMAAIQHPGDGFALPAMHTPKHN